MDATTTFKNIREHLSLSQQNIADLARVDVALVEKYEKGELSLVTHDQIVAHEQIVGAMFKVVAERYPEQLKAAVQPALDEAKKYPEGSEMRNFLNRAGDFLKP
jgi:transcriptional regulator with XRE-family HTH domain